jgi:tetratricopeptide (TPR) repeat protein
VLELLHGLPLALTQAGSYMRETNTSAATYAKHYSRTWGQLVKSEGRFPLQEYGDRSVLTTWTISYEQVQRQSEEAACLLRLWGFLDSGEVWYELIAAGSDLAAGTDVPAWLLAIAQDELAFSEAMGLLSRYSLAEGKDGTDSHSMHSVLHRWCRYLVGKEEQQELGCLAAGLVASSVPSKSDAEFGKKRKQVMAHGLCVSSWIEEHSGWDKERVVEGSRWLGCFYKLGCLLDDEDRQRAEQMYQRALEGYERKYGPGHALTLNTVNKLGMLYANQDRREEAEQMYQRALEGYEKTERPEHTSTLDTVNNLGVLYVDLGRIEEAEQMYRRALEGYGKALGPDHVSTLNTVDNLGLLYTNLGRVQEAEQMYQRALAGKKKAWGAEHTSTLNTVNNLGDLYADLGRLDEAEKLYQRALGGYAKAISPENLMTYVPALNNMWAFASLRESQGLIDDAIDWYSQVLLGYQKTLGPDHDRCEFLRNKLALLVGRAEGQNSSANIMPIAASTEEHPSKQNIAESIASLTMLT